MLKKILKGNFCQTGFLRKLTDSSIKGHMYWATCNYSSPAKESICFYKSPLYDIQKISTSITEMLQIKDNFLSDILSIQMVKIIVLCYQKIIH